MTTVVRSGRRSRSASNFKILRDTKRYRVLSMEGEADPQAAADDRAKRRFRGNVQTESGRYIPLESIRITYIPMNAAQVVAAPEELRAMLAETPLEEAELRMPLPYAVSAGRCYILLNTFANLDEQQIRAFFEDQLFPWFAELGLDADSVEPVLVPNRER